MRVCVLASGSKGNSTYVETEDAKLLIDAGLSKKELENRLTLIGVNPSSIDAILITHEHSDHIKGLGQFVKTYNTKVFAHKDSWAMIDEKAQTIPVNCEIEFNGKDFNIFGTTIQTFDLDHDSNHCVGFSVIEKNNRFSTATDLGHMTDEILKVLKESDLITLESNHDIKTLLNNPNYTYSLKQRILSNHGHISNEECSKTILSLLGFNPRGVILGHLSEQNNTPNLAIQTLNNVLVSNGVTKDDFSINIQVAMQHTPTKIFKLKDKN